MLMSRHVSELSTSSTIIEEETSEPQSTGTAFLDPFPDKHQKQETISGLPSTIDDLERPHPHRREGTVDPTTIPEVIPERTDPNAPRTIILCFDGTGDQFDNDNSNVAVLTSLLKKNDSRKQLVYYQSGIGTYKPSDSLSPFTSGVDKVLDKMFAQNLQAHVTAGYQFLMQNYVDGDKICLFGFSRGAYTVRSLVGMLDKIGLLPAGNHEQLPFAYTFYKREDPTGYKQCAEFKKAFCVDMKIEFVGVWDTVDSVGLYPKRLPLTPSTMIHTFRHAISLDERRAKFKVDLWNRRNAKEADLGIIDGRKSYITANTRGGSRLTRGSTLSNEESEKLQKAVATTEGTAEEVWFAGCHCDVGGGSVSNMTRYSLARIPLRWMIRECFRTQSGILFLSKKLEDVGLDPRTLYPYVLKRPQTKDIGANRISRRPKDPPPISFKNLVEWMSRLDSKADLSIEPKREPFKDEEDEELADALSPKYDQLNLKKGWWVLEYLPLTLRYQNAENKTVTYWAANKASPRLIPQQKSSEIKVHRSVKLRMEAEYEDEKKRLFGKRYTPRPLFEVEPTWVE